MTVKVSALQITTSDKLRQPSFVERAADLARQLLDNAPNSTATGAALGSYLARDILRGGAPRKNDPNTRNNSKQNARRGAPLAQSKKRGLRAKPPKNQKPARKFRRAPIRRHHPKRGHNIYGPSPRARKVGVAPLNPKAANSNTQSPVKGKLASLKNFIGSVSQKIKNTVQQITSKLNLKISQQSGHTASPVHQKAKQGLHVAQQKLKAQARTIAAGVGSATGRLKGWLAKMGPSCLKWGGRALWALHVWAAWKDGKEKYVERLRKGDSEAEAKVSGVAHGFLKGGATLAAGYMGAKIGFAIGTAIPGLGNVVGAAVGFVIGVGLAYGASALASYAVDKFVTHHVENAAKACYRAAQPLYKSAQALGNKVINIAKPAWDYVKNAASYLIGRKAQEQPSV